MAWEEELDLLRVPFVGCTFVVRVPLARRRCELEE